MKYYSEKLNKLFDTSEELIADEHSYEMQRQKEETEKKIREEKRNKLKADLEASRKNYMDLLKQYYEDYGYDANSIYDSMRLLFDTFGID